MEAEGHFGTRLVLEDGVLEIFMHGVSVVRLRQGDTSAIRRIPRKDGLALSVRTPDGGGKMLAFNAEQTPAAEALLAAFESR